MLLHIFKTFLSQNYQWEKKKRNPYSCSSCPDGDHEGFIGLTWEFSRKHMESKEKYLVNAAAVVRWA